MVPYLMLDSHVPTTALAATPVLTAPLTVAEWQARAVAHLERAQQWTRPFRERRSRGEVHPVYDFLFQYYHYSGGRLEAWHPGPDEALEDSSAARERFTSPVYVAANGVAEANPLGSDYFFPEGRGPRICLGAEYSMFFMKLVIATLLQTSRFECGAGQTYDAGQKFFFGVRMPAGLRGRFEPQNDR